MLTTSAPVVAVVTRSLIFSVKKHHHEYPSLLHTSQFLLPFISTSPASLRTLTTVRRRSPRQMAGADSDTAVVDDALKYGFERPEMYSSSLANTVDPPYDRHVFLCYKSYEHWPSRVEDSETDLLPKLFSSALKARKTDIKVKTRFTVCGASDGTEFSDGDVIIFPEMVKYRGLKESDVESFVDDVLVSGKPWVSGLQEALTGAFVFVCAHANRDKRCGVCGPVLIDKFNEEVKSRGLEDQVFVNSCSHIGGHKYAGNVIIFGTNAEGKVIGDWYGYVAPNDVPDLIDVHIGKGEIIERLWRGRMGVYVEDAEKSAKKLHKEKSLERSKEVPQKEKSLERSKEAPQENGSQQITENASGCCQGANGVSCCQAATPALNGGAAAVEPKNGKEAPGALPWLGKWDQSEILMAAAVVGAVATVAVAYSFCRRSA